MASQRDLFEDESQNGYEEGEVDVDEPDEPQYEENDAEEAQPNDYDPKTKKTKKFKDGELAIIVDHMEENLETLTGHCRDHEYKRIRNNAWRNMVDDINRWNEQNGTGIIRGYISV